MKAKNVAHPEAPAVQEWDEVAAAVGKDYVPKPESDGPKRYTTWLTTINPDGSPHVTAVGGVWLDDTFWFQTGDTTRKAKNIVRDPRCTMSISVNELDFVVEGKAEKIDDPTDVKRVVAEFNKGDWPCEVDDTGIGITAPFNAPGIGPAPWYVYRIAPRAASAVITNQVDEGSTRWTF